MEEKRILGFDFFSFLKHDFFERAFYTTKPIIIRFHLLLHLEKAHFVSTRGGFWFGL